MSWINRITITFALTSSLWAGLAAAQEAAAPEAKSTATTATVTETAADAATDTAAAEEVESRRGSEHVRSEFIRMLREHPPEVGSILALDPTLLSNEPFLAGYPEIAAFVAKHPEVRRSPDYFLGEFAWRPQPRNFAQEVVEGLGIFSIFVFIALVLTWIIRTIIEQRRWSRLAKTQTEVHNKILDRFGSSEELLAYMKTPAGARFLESAPIPLHADKPAQHTPFNRVLWSIQFGVIVAAAAIGLLFVSLRFDAEASRELFAMGVIALCVGAGFIVSAAISILLSKRLGMWKSPEPGASGSVEDPGLVR